MKKSSSSAKQQVGPAVEVKALFKAEDTTLIFRTWLFLFDIPVWLYRTDSVVNSGTEKDMKELTKIIYSNFFAKCRKHPYVVEVSAQSVKYGLSGRERKKYVAYRMLGVRKCWITIPFNAEAVTNGRL